MKVLQSLAAGVTRRRNANRSCIGSPVIIVGDSTDAALLAAKSLVASAFGDAATTVDF